MALPAAQNEYSYDTQFANERISDAGNANASATASNVARTSSVSPNSAETASAEYTTRRRPSQRLRHSQKRHSSSQSSTRSSATRTSSAARNLDSTFVPRTATVPRSLRRPHRAFRLSATTGVLGALLFLQFLGALWLKSLVFSAAHQNDALVQKIADTEAEIDKAQRQIAILGTDPKLGEWATKMGYRPAQQSDLDDVSRIDSATNNTSIEYSNGSPVASNTTAPNSTTANVTEGGR